MSNNVSKGHLSPDLSFEDFKILAKRTDLSVREKVGFPESYRVDNETAIFSDILDKCPNLRARGKRVLEIGPGCSELPHMLVAHCERHSHSLWLVDSEEMLALIPGGDDITHISGSFPEAFDNKLGKLSEWFDVIICYSVIQYPFMHQNITYFFDRCLALLSDGGQLLIGDIPNVSMRKRFLASPSGKEFSVSYNGSQSEVSVPFNNLEPGRIDDSTVMWLLSRARLQGFHSWVLPQKPGLPMSNRREDILIVRP